MVIWLMGISGSGKSTIGAWLEKYLGLCGLEPAMLDGDTVRAFFNNDLGYTKEDRVANIKRIIFGAYLLSQYRPATIVCNIAPFEHLRLFAREKLPEYVEIYLKKDIAKSIKNDCKNIYRGHLGKTDVVGVDIAFEEPAHSDLIIDVDSMTKEQSMEAIKIFLINNFPERVRDLDL
jgi:adenylylsulfate kinase-like enzyme